MRDYFQRINSREIRIFLGFLLIFTLFIHWVGANEWSRYDLTTSMVEDQSFEISKYSDNTMDKLASADKYWIGIEKYDRNGSKKRNIVAKSVKYAFNKSNKIYSDKAPLSSFLAVPGYMIGDFIGGFNSQESDMWVDKEVEDIPIHISFQTAVKQFFIVFTVSAVFGSLLLVLIYRSLAEKVDERVALYTVIIAGIATPIFTYSSSFFGVINAAVFGFGSYMAINKAEDADRKWMYVAGILSALAFSTEYYAGLIAMGLVAYIFLKEKEKIPPFVGGVLLGAIPLFLYQWAVTGNPLIPPILSTEFVPAGPINAGCSIYEACYSDFGILGFVLAPLRALNAIFRLLFFPTRGLFFYSPILLLAIPGCYEIYKKNRKLLIVFPGIFLLFLVFQAFQLNWLAGASFGPRYMVVGLPFLLLPTALGLDKMMDKGKKVQIFVLLVFIFSVFNMLLGFNVLGGSELDEDTYSDRFHSFSAVQPDLYTDMVNKFERYGPRSEVMMSFTDRYKGLDITYRSPYGSKFIETNTTKDGGVLFSLNLLPIILAGIILTAVFWPEFNIVKILGLTAIVILFLASFTVSSTYILGETYRGQGYEKGVNGSLTTVFHTEEGEVPYLEARVVTPPGQTADVDVLVNGKLQEYNISGSKELYFPLDTHEGRNEIRLETPDCLDPILYSNSTEGDCLTVSVKNLSHYSADNIKAPLLLQGWHDQGVMPEEGVRMRDKGQLAIRSEGGARLLRISATVPGYVERNELKVATNGEKLDILRYSEPTYALANFKEGWNSLSLDVGNCVVPATRSNSSDNRCIGLNLQDIEVLDENELSNPLIYGFYGELDEKPWMKQQSKIFFSSESRHHVPVMEIGETPFVQSQNLSITVNGEHLRTVDRAERGRKIYLTEASIREGLNEIELESSGCKVPAYETNRSSDTRCLSFKLENFSVISEPTSSTIFSHGWYDEERVGRWMAEESLTVFRTDGDSSVLELNLKPYKQMENNDVNAEVNGENISSVTLGENKILIPVEAGQMLNSLTLRSQKGCGVPAKLENYPADSRCLSFLLNEFSVKERVFGRGWYGDELDSEKIRWMREEAEVKFSADSNLTEISLKVAPYEHLSDPVLNVSLNGQSSNSIELQSSRVIEKNITVETEKGINTLKLKSISGCEVPAEVEEDSSDNRCLSFDLKSLEFDEATVWD